MQHVKTEADKTPRAARAAIDCAEDPTCGDFVAVLLQIHEFPSFFWPADAVALPPRELVRLKCLPDAGDVPWPIRAICLPFVLVETPARDVTTVDVRQVELVRLDAAYARYAWKRLRRAARPRSLTARGPGAESS